MRRQAKLRSRPNPKPQQGESLSSANKIPAGASFGLVRITRPIARTRITQALGLREIDEAYTWRALAIVAVEDVGDPELVG
jgi:hypothetical protein